MAHQPPLRRAGTSSFGCSRALSTRMVATWPGNGPRPWPTSCSRDLPRCARRDWRTGTRVQDRWRVVWLIGACTDPRVQPRFLQRTQGGTSCAETLEGLRLLQSNVNLACIRHLLDHVSVRTTEDYDRLAAGVMLRESRPPAPRPAGLPMPATYGNPPQNVSDRENVRIRPDYHANPWRVRACAIHARGSLG